MYFPGPHSHGAKAPAFRRAALLSFHSQGLVRLRKGEGKQEFEAPTG